MLKLWKIEQKGRKLCLEALWRELTKVYGEEYSVSDELINPYTEQRCDNKTRSANSDNIGDRLSDILVIPSIIPELSKELWR